MRKIKYKKGKKVVPTFLEYTGSHKKVATEMQLFVYDSENLAECTDHKCQDLLSIIDFNKVNWLNIHGLNEISVIKEVGDFLKVDNFMLGDILNTTKRTKLDEYHDVLFFNVKSLLPIENSDNINVEQISFLLKDGILASFQEKKSDFFTHIRERIRTHSGVVREKKADYLLYLLLDAIMENFYITIENEEDRVEALINLSKTNTKPIEINYRLQFFDGRIKWINEICSSDFDAEGNPIRSYGTLQDITSYKLAEEQSIQKEEQYNRLIDSSWSVVEGYCVRHSKHSFMQLQPDDTRHDDSVTLTWKTLPPNELYVPAGGHIALDLSCSSFFLTVEGMKSLAVPMSKVPPELTAMLPPTTVQVLVNTRLK